MLVYLNLRDLLALGEQVGLAEDPAYARLRARSAHAGGGRARRRSRR